jgi:chromosome segregation ATPase
MIYRTTVNNISINKISNYNIMTTMLPCGNCALKDAENTNLTNALFINTLIHNYSLTDVIKNVIEEEVRKEIKKVVDTTTEGHLCKLKTCIALKDARIEHLVQTDTEKDLERAKKDMEREVRDGKLDKYIEILIQSNKEKDMERDKKDLERDKLLDKYMEILIQSNSENDLKKSNGKCEIRQLNEKIDEILSRLTSVEDGLKKLKMEVTEVKMEVTKLKKVANTSKSGFSKRRGGKIFRAFQAG